MAPVIVKLELADHCRLLLSICVGLFPFIIYYFIAIKFMEQ